MKTLIILFLLSFNILFSQDLNDIKKLDTIYILFKKGVEQNKLWIKNYDNNGYSIREMFFKTDYIEDGFVKGRQSNILCKPKSFLKKHKNKIIDFQFMRKYSRLEIVDGFAEKPRIYFIIDKDEIKNKTIKLREVNAPTFLIE